MSIKRCSGWVILLFPVTLWANVWQDLWLNKNQQAADLFNEHKNKEAATLFTDSRWQGAAFYRDKNYQAALAAFQKDHSAEGLYNQGNALAQLHDYQKAIDAYKAAVDKKPDFTDAKANLEYVENLLKQQNDQQQQQNKQQDNKQDNKDQKNQDKQDKTSQADNDRKDKQDQQSDQNQNNQVKQKKDQSKSRQPQNNEDNQQNSSDNKSANTDTRKNSANDSLDKKETQAQKAQENEENNKNKEKSAEMENNELAKKNTKKHDLQQAVTYSAQTKEEALRRKKIDALLSQIPDDPGGLLKQKFLRDYQARQAAQNGDNND